MAITKDRNFISIKLSHAIHKSSDLNGCALVRAGKEQASKEQVVNRGDY